MKGEKEIRDKLLSIQGLLEYPSGAMHVEKAMYWRECLEWVLEVDCMGTDRTEN